MYAFASLSTTS
ncbi:hypothetical protein D046_7044A, partial [Vibrio parahaemolyticus V-223/04]